MGRSNPISSFWCVMSLSENYFWRRRNACHDYLQQMAGLISWGEALSTLVSDVSPTKSNPIVAINWGLLQNCSPSCQAVHPIREAYRPLRPCLCRIVPASNPKGGVESIVILNGRQPTRKSQVVSTCYYPLLGLLPQVHRRMREAVIAEVTQSLRKARTMFFLFRLSSFRGITLDVRPSSEM